MSQTFSKDMDPNWKFTTLKYERPDFDAVEKGLKELTETVKNASNGQQVIDAIYEHDRREAQVYSIITIVMVRHTIDTTDEFYEKENQYLNNVLPTLQPADIAFNDAVEASPFRADVEKAFGKQYFVQSDLSKKGFCEKNIPLMQKEAQLCDEYQKIMATCQIQFDGKTVNLYGIQKYFEDADRSVRKAAFKAFSDFYRSHEDRLEEIWDELIRIRNEMGTNLGFENFIPLGYIQQGRTDYGVKEVEAFRKQVREVVVPLCRKLYDAQAKRLGIDKVMAYDENRVFPDGNAIPAGDDDFMIRTAQGMYHDMSKETGEFIDFMIDHELLDLKNKPGKASTGYMTALPSLKAPFVFSCFNNTIFDMEVLSHELGHAFAGYQAMRHQPILALQGETTDIAEIHSMSMEQFAYPYAERFFGKDADKYRFQHLQEAITFVPFGTAVDEFQHICYQHPELTPKERTYEWHKLEKIYMPWRTYEDDEFMERGGYWYYKLHIFLYPMYYINYCFTTMGALENKKKMADDPQGCWNDYLALCNIGGAASYLETLKLAHLSVPFAEGTVKKVMEYPAKILMDQIGRMEKA